MDENNFISALKTRKILMKKCLENEVCKYINEILSVQNVTIFYEVSRIFKLSMLSNIAFSHIESCFTTVADSDNFLELGSYSVSKILASNGLQTTSELEVSKAANKWLNHNIKERTIFANDLLLKIRLPFLSNQSLNCLLNETLYLYKDIEYVSIIKEFLRTKKISYYDKNNAFYTNRYCNQNKFNIIVSGGYNEETENDVTDVLTIDLEDEQYLKNLPPCNESRADHKIVVIKSQIFVLGDYYNPPDEVYSKSVEKYSFITNTWNKVAELVDDLKGHCACAFMDKIFVIGGLKENTIVSNCCMQLDTKDYKWHQIANLKEARGYAACSVFEGKIVVCGGESQQRIMTNTVQLYDQASDVWLYMPNMIKERHTPESVAIRNKLYVMGGGVKPCCEVFDSVCNQFTLVKSTPTSLALGYLLDPIEAVSIGSKILVFCSYGDEILSYDVEEDEWSTEACQATENISFYSCVKVPKLLVKSVDKLNRN